MGTSGGKILLSTVVSRRRSPRLVVEQSGEDTEWSLCSGMGSEEQGRLASFRKVTT